MIGRLIRANRLATTLETGVATGISTLAICEALEFNRAEYGCDVLHYGVDPCQTEEHQGAALMLLKVHGLDSAFRLLEGPAHLVMPGLVEQGTTVDLVLIDGWHTFDYTLIDFFFADKLLRSGGYLAIHDMHMPAKLKVVDFILTHRKYRTLPTPELAVRWDRRVRLMLRAAKRRSKQLLRVRFGGANLCVLRKEKHYEPEWHFYHDF